MGKSSSNKRKTSKYSSQGRAKKKSKTRRTRSKRLRRRDDLVAYSSNDSRSSVSDSSSSEDKYRSRSSRSRTRKVLKGTKRRVRSYSSSSDESHRKRKQKGSKRNDDSEVRKKSLRNKKKKKGQKDASISSRSSGSLSCSTCWSSSSSSDESEYESLRGRSERREKNVRKLKNVKSGTKKRKYKSRSCSSCSRHNGSIDDWSEEKVSGGIISKRLKSVITLANEDKEGREFTWDEHKEEMIYDHDDYPSSRSNDSNDGGNKSVSAHQSHGASERARPIEIEKREDASVCNIKTTKHSDSYKDGDDQYVRSKPACVRVGTNDAIEEKNNEMSEATGGVNGDDLESILRQKALENLRRFRGGFQTNATNAVNKKDKSDGALKSVSTRKAELSQTESSQDYGAQGVMGNSAHSMKKDEKLLSEKNSGNGSVSAKNNAHLPNQVAVSSRDKVVSGINKPRLVTSALKQALSKATTTAMEVPDSWVSDKAKLVTGSSASKNNATALSGNNNDDKINNASGSASCYASAGDVIMNKLKDEGKEGSSMVPLNNSSNGGAINNASGSSSVEPSSHIASAARDISSNKDQDDGKEGSQLEEKTMSVMRGGEMVQVSYKVYIPKKAPALARRQLKR